MLVIRNSKHFDAVVQFARDHCLYEPDPSKPNIQRLKRALDRLESFERKGPDGQPTVRVVLSPDFAPHSFEFLVERSVTDGWEATSHRRPAVPRTSRRLRQRRRTDVRGLAHFGRGLVDPHASPSTRQGPAR